MGCRRKAIYSLKSPTCKLISFGILDDFIEDITYSLILFIQFLCMHSRPSPILSPRQLSCIYGWIQLTYYIRCLRFCMVASLQQEKRRTFETTLCFSHNNHGLLRRGYVPTQRFYQWHRQGYLSPDFLCKRNQKLQLHPQVVWRLPIEALSLRYQLLVFFLRLKTTWFPGYVCLNGFKWDMIPLYTFSRVGWNIFICKTLPIRIHWRDPLSYVARDEAKRWTAQRGR